MTYPPRRVFAAVILLFVARAFAQDAATTPASQPTTTAPAPAVPPPFPLGEVTAQAEAATAAARGTEGELEADTLPAKIAAELPAVAQEVNSRADETARIVHAGPSLEALRGLEADWAAQAETLNGWKGELAKRGASLDKGVLRLAWFEDIWGKMSAYAAANPVPPEMAQRAAAVLALTRQAKGEAEKRRALVLTLQTRVSEAGGRAADAQAAVRGARAGAVDRLLSQDSPPIWDPDARPRTGDALVAEGRQSFAAQVTALRAYAVRKRTTFATHAAVILALVPVLYWVRRRARAWAREDPSFQRAATVFDAPPATAVLLALLASSWFYPNAPRLFWAVLVAAALVPAVVILRRVLYASLLPILNALVVFYVVDQLRAVAASQAIVARLLLMAEMLGGALFLVWWLRTGRLSTALGAGGDRLAWAVVAVARAGGIVFVVSFVAAAVGYVTLAALLGNAVLGSAYLGLILYAGVRIVDGLTMSALRARPLSLLATVRRNRNLFWDRVRRLFHWGALLLWVRFTLDMLSLRPIVVERAWRVLTTPLTIGSVSLSLWQVAAFGLTVWVTLLLSRFVRFVLDEDVYPRFQLARGLPYAISTTLHYVILLVGFVTAVGMLGYDMTKFTILAGAFGVGLGFGLQNIFNNFISGLILLFERPIKVGDVVQIGDAVGVVRRIGIRASIVRTANGAEIIMPNGKLISDPVTNWTLSSRKRGIDLTLAVAAGTDPKRVMDVWHRVAVDHPRVSPDPPPNALLNGLGSGGLTFDLHAWIDDSDEWQQTRSDLAVAMTAALAEAGVAMK